MATIPQTETFRFCRKAQTPKFPKAHARTVRGDHTPRTRYSPRAGRAVSREPSLHSSVDAGVSVWPQRGSPLPAAHGRGRSSSSKQRARREGKAPRAPSSAVLAEPREMKMCVRMSGTQALVCVWGRVTLPSRLLLCAPQPSGVRAEACGWGTALCTSAENWMRRGPRTRGPPPVGSISRPRPRGGEDGGRRSCATSHPPSPAGPHALGAGGRSHAGSDRPRLGPSGTQPSHGHAAPGTPPAPPLC